MFVTEPQRHQIRTWLAGLSQRVEWMLNLVDRGDRVDTEDEWAFDLTQRLAAERALHTSCEYMTDVASLVIDALVMRDPGGYADIIKVLVEEDVLTETWFAEIKGLFDFRARLIRDHANITPEEVRDATVRYAVLMPEFTARVADYLKL